MPGIPSIEPYPMPAADELPGNVAAWTVDPGRAVLLLHDMQRFFLRPFPAGSPRDQLLANAARLRNRCAGLGTPVAYTAQPGSMTPKQRGLLVDFWGPGMQADPHDREIVDPLQPDPADWQLVKWRYSAFHDSDLLDRMRASRRDQLVVCGVYAHVGVLMTVADAFSHDIETFMVADATADFDPQHHRWALEYAAQRCAVVVDTAAVLARLPRTREGRAHRARCAGGPVGQHGDLLDRVLGERPPVFALLHRPVTAGRDTLEVVVGAKTTGRTLAQLPLPPAGPGGGGARHDLLALIPYRQVTERGFACVEDNTPLVAMTISDQATLPLFAAMSRLPQDRPALSQGRFDIDDEAYAQIVRDVVECEIGRGNGSNFVIKRCFLLDVEGWTHRTALAVFRRLLKQEIGVYWTFLVHLGDRTLVGATPERHVSLRDGIAVMNPISGTYRYPASGPDLGQLMRFLADVKEREELYMVVDEELKMMSRICSDGGSVTGPYLREMARLAHTEYVIQGRSERDVRDVLRETMFAPTVTGSPLESATRVIQRYEPDGRGYYGGVVAVIGRDDRGGPVLDSSILIRTADIDRAGHVRIAVGASLVRHSDPLEEAAETRAKAAGLLGALGVERTGRLADSPEVQEALARRNTELATFWFRDASERVQVDPEIAGRRVLVVDAEDTFTSMFTQQLRSLGLVTVVSRFNEPYDLDGHDLVVMGPGPGDPRDHRDPRMAQLCSALDVLLALHRPFLAVCLSHQLLCLRLGLDVERCEVPHQGLQRPIDLFGVLERVGFYNTFSARSSEDKLECPGVGMVEVSRNADTGEVNALRGAGFASVQFHAESVLTQDGVRILGRLVKGVLKA